MDEARSREAGYALAFETSSAQGCVALGRGRTVLEVRSFGGPRRHAADFLPTIAALCRAHSVPPADVRRVFVSIGPGSFTGLRIGVAAARMLALAGDAEAVGVPTLEVIAQNAREVIPPPDRVAVVLDANRQRVYAATFRRRDEWYIPERNAAEEDPSTFLAGLDSRSVVVGEGVAPHLRAVQASGLTALPKHLFPPRAETVYLLGLARAERGEPNDRQTLVPLYVRPPEAEERWEKEHRRQP